MGDLISRQDAIDALGEEPEVWYSDDDIGNGMRTQWGCDREAIEALPSAQQKGKWIYLYDGNYKCSECGAWWTCEETPVNSGMNFCPNCGADMRGSDA